MRPKFVFKITVLAVNILDLEQKMEKYKGSLENITTDYDSEIPKFNNGLANKQEIEIRDLNLTREESDYLNKRLDRRANAIKSFQEKLKRKKLH